MTDLFGHGQQSLFGDADDRIPHPKQPDIAPSPERVREKLLALLDTARAAERMPWSARKADMWQIVFPQMANWLPPAERDQLRFDFAKELERLKLAA